MKLNESKFLEELREIDGEIKSACLEICRPRAVPSEPTPEQKADMEKEDEERERLFYISTHEASKRLSHLLSLVTVDPFEALIDALYPIVQSILQDSLNRSYSVPTYVGKVTKPTPNDERGGKEG